jgi:hypothetical protein
MKARFDGSDLRFKPPLPATDRACRLRTIRQRIHLKKNGSDTAEHAMGQQNRHWVDEPDIGSGEKSPAQSDLEREQDALGQGAGRSKDGAQAARTDGEQAFDRPPADPHTLRSGDHLARFITRRLDDGTYEAQVYVRLTREPELAETYIPAGSFSTEEEARSAAEERARRALEEREF